MAGSDQGSLERAAPCFAVRFGGRPVHSRLERAAAADEASDFGRRLPHADAEAGERRRPERRRLRSEETSTRVPMRSAWNCIRKRFALAPPSARRTPTSSGRTSSTSATWCAIASSAARTRCARVEPRVRPQINPRASGSHCGEPRPVSAGTKNTPSVEATSGRERLGLGCGLDHAEPVAQPLERGAADEHGALGGELGRRRRRDGGGRPQQRRSRRARGARRG